MLAPTPAGFPVTQNSSVTAAGIIAHTETPADLSYPLSSSVSPSTPH